MGTWLYHPIVRRESVPAFEVVSTQLSVVGEASPSPQQDVHHTMSSWKGFRQPVAL